jgi:hypothetical protein
MILYKKYSSYPGIPDGIDAKLIIGVFIDFNHAYIEKIETTYNSINADIPSKA